MNRKYTAEEFLLMVDKIKESKKEPFLSSDLILGFPGETDNDFEETQNTLKKADFSYILTLKNQNPIITQHAVSLF